MNAAKTVGNFSGDFRFELPVSYYPEDHEDCDTQLPGVWDILTKYPIDHLYLDTTYWDCEAKFLSRQMATEQIIDIIKDRSSAVHKVLIAVRRLGKEDLLRLATVSVSSTYITHKIVDNFPLFVNYYLAQLPKKSAVGLL